MSAPTAKKMEVNLQPIDETQTNFSETQRFIFNNIRTSLQSPLAPPTKAAQIADHLHLRFALARSPSSLADSLWNTWIALVEVVYAIPPDHEWQGILVDALNLLRGREDVVAGADAVRYPDATSQAHSHPANLHVSRKPLA